MSASRAPNRARTSNECFTSAMSVSSAFPRTNCMTCFYDSLASKSKAARLGQSDNLKNGRSSGSGPPRPRRKHAEATANNPGNANIPTGVSQSDGRRDSIACLRVLGTVQRPRLAAPGLPDSPGTDGQGRPLKQRELCERHTDWLKANRPNVHDVRNAPDA
jgi:hypothetical protein